PGFRAFQEGLTHFHSFHRLASNAPHSQHALRSTRRVSPANRRRGPILLLRADGLGLWAHWEFSVRDCGGCIAKISEVQVFARDAGDEYYGCRTTHHYEGAGERQDDRRLHSEIH